MEEIFLKVFRYFIFKYLLIFFLFFFTKTINCTNVILKDAIKIRVQSNSNEKLRKCDSELTLNGGTSQNIQLFIYFYIQNKNYLFIFNSN